jgi:hypothetical protein
VSGRSRETPALVALVLLALPAWLGCSSRDDEGPAAATPAATMIPVGAPGAEGARFDPAPPSRLPKPSSLEQRIDPGPSPVTPGPNPVTPPSPFGVPPSVEGPAEPASPPTKKQKGTKI